MKNEKLPFYNVMLLTKGSTSHYCHIKNLSRLLYSQQHAEGHHYHYCIRCLQGFSSQAVLQKHSSLCRGASSRPTRIDMPEKGNNTLKFQNYQRQMKAPYVIYADFESIIEKYDTCIPPTDRSSTTKTEVHKPCDFSLVAVRSDGEVKGKKACCYRGEDCVKQFLATLLQAEMEIREELTHKKKMAMIKEDWRAFDGAKECHICGEDLIRHNEKDKTELWDSETGAYFGKVHKYKQAPVKGDKPMSCYQYMMNIRSTDKWHKRDYKTKKETLKEYPDESDYMNCGEPLLREKFRDAVRDHCHITGKYRGAAHNVCNLKLRINPKTTIIPVVFHNLRGYDAHHIMQEIGNINSNIKCIPNNMEKYISFSLGNLRFIDSFQFLLSSLDSLVASNKPEDFEIMKQFEEDDERRALILRKGVYPYEYMVTFERFNEASLPPKEVFYSKLTDSHISDEDYEHAKKVWKAYECETLGDYHDLYLATDTLLLADVFENFRKTCLKHYGLDPAHYYTSPGLSLLSNTPESNSSS